ncbi:MAG: YicC family protein [Clostridia bacterium]|nr:YicC family protein [Clostridia bacterium]
MVSSMTGFGRGTAQAEGREITIELKSVNHRYLDIGYRMPRQINFLEDVFRAELSERLSRGHVDVYVNYRNLRNDSKTVEIDKGLLSAYLEAAKIATDEFELENDLKLTSALRFQDVLTVVSAEEDREALVSLSKEALNMAIDELKAMRAKEGERLANDLLNRLDTIDALRAQIEKRAPQVVEEYRAKLSERIEKLLSSVTVDQQRLATEVAIFADKASIDEETVRLTSHVKGMKELLASSEATGRKLDFLVQEMNREFNTIGSKANDGEIVAFVIDGKAEVEKIREQVQNIE